MKRTVDVFRAATLAVLLGGCAGAAPESVPPEIPTVTVTETTSSITLDGKLDEAAWAATPGYALKHFDDTSGLPELEAAVVARDPFESAEVKFLYDKNYLYVGCTLNDSDVTAYCDRDQERLFRYGDLLEVFLWPEHGTWYWELYAAPNGARSSFFYPGGGQRGNWEFFSEKYLMKDFAVASRIDGTRNRHNDRDRGWSTEMRIPLAELAKAGIPFAPGNAWRLMAARYNYGAEFYQLQFSSFPEMPNSNYHFRRYYAPVLFRFGEPLQKSER